MKILPLAILLLITSPSVLALNQWNYLACNGADNNGNPVNLTTYANSFLVVINGDAHLIVSKTANGKGIVTANFLSDTGVYVYDSIESYNSTNLTINQYNAVTQELVSKTDLSCQFFGKSLSKSTDQQIFKSPS